MAEAAFSFSWIHHLLVQFYRALLGLLGTLERVHLQRFLCQEYALVLQMSVKSSELCKHFDQAPLRAMQSVGIKRYKAWSKRTDGSITEKHSSFHYGELRESAGNGDNFLWAHLFFSDGKNNVPMKAGGRARFFEALFCLIGVFSVAEFSSMNSSRWFGCTGLCSQVRPFANSLSG